MSDQTTHAGPVPLQCPLTSAPGPATVPAVDRMRAAPVGVAALSGGRHPVRQDFGESSGAAQGHPRTPLIRRVSRPPRIPQPAFSKFLSSLTSILPGRSTHIFRMCATSPREVVSGPTSLFPRPPLRRGLVLCAMAMVSFPFQWPEEFRILRPRLFLEDRMGNIPARRLTEPAWSSHEGCHEAIST